MASRLDSSGSISGFGSLECCIATSGIFAVRVQCVICHAVKLLNNSSVAFIMERASASVSTKEGRGPSGETSMVDFCVHFFTYHDMLFRVFKNGSTFTYTEVSSIHI